MGGVLLLEGIALMTFPRMTVLPMAVVTMVVFSLFVQMSEGATFGVVPFINKNPLGARGRPGRRRRPTGGTGRPQVGAGDRARRSRSRFRGGLIPAKGRTWPVIREPRMRKAAPHGCSSEDRQGGIALLRGRLCRDGNR